MSAVDEISQVSFEISEDKLKAWGAMRGVYIPRLVNSALQKVIHLETYDEHEGKFVIVGAGPSVSEELDALRELSLVHPICSLNGAHGWLIRKEIIPKIHILLEPDVENIEQQIDGPLNKEVTYYICSATHENVFEQLKDHKVVLWHVYANPQEYKDIINLLFPDEPVISGGLLTLFRLIMIGYTLGYRSFDLFGIDSSFKDGSDHVDGYTLADIEPGFSLDVPDENNNFRRFKTNSGLIMQAQLFCKFIELYPDLNIKIHGDSLLKFLHKIKRPEIYV